MWALYAERETITEPRRRIGEPLAQTAQQHSGSDESQRPTRSVRGFDAGVCGVLGLLTLWVYAPSLSFDFVTMDDYRYVVENEAIARGLDIETVRWAFTTFRGSSWFPLTWLSFALDHAIGGLDASVYHRTNLLWHVASVLMLYFAFVALTRARWSSAAVAAVFALHPVHVESVAWVAERKDVLSAFFFAATLLAWARFVERPGAARYAFVVGMFALGLLSKSSLVTLPFLLLLLDLWPLGRTRLPLAKRVAEKLPLFAMAAAAAYLTITAGASGEALEAESFLGFEHRLANAAIAYAAYLRDTLWPASLTAFYPHPGRSVSFALAGSCALGLVAITGFAYRVRRTHPHVLVGWLWFLGMLVPMIGLVQAGAQARADRFLHLAQSGLVVAGVWSIPKSMARPAIALGLVLVVALSIATRQQLGIWRDAVTLFEAVLEASPDLAFAHQGLAEAHWRRGQYVEAEAAYRRALEHRPDWSAPRFGLAQVLEAQGRSSEATPHYVRAAEQEPEDLGLRARVANRLLAEGALDRALPHLAFVIEHGDAQAAASAHLLSGAIREKSGATARATEHYREAARLKPDSADPHLALAKLAQRAGDERGEQQALRAAVKAEPDSLVAHNNLAWQLVHARDTALRDPKAALQHAQLAAALSRRGVPAVLETLAVAWIAIGEPERARAVLDEAIELANSRDEAALARELLRRRRALARPGEGEGA